jgi:ABC-type histidine transport system ATPase subunit
MSNQETSVFINFTNHYPSSQWEESQQSAAAAYGTIKDLPFPNVQPNASEEEIEGLVDEYVQKMKDLAGNAKLTVLVMGEMTFAFAMINRLKKMGIDCVATTTERNVIAEEGGKKTAVFKFVRFRKY